MSIVPFGGGSPSSSSSLSPLDKWDPEILLNLDLWDPLFPSLPIFGSRETQLKWRETPRAHVLRAVFPSSAGEVGVLVHIDDDDMLQISTEDGGFMSRFKLPEDARRDGVTASVDGGVVTVTVPKVGARRPNVRNVEITGSG